MNNYWQSVDIGGGGFVVGMDIAPDNTMVVRTDTDGAYIWNGTRWQQLVTSTSMPAAFVMPNVGDGVYEIRIAPSNTNILYMEYRGYVFRSDDQGSTWAETAFAPVSSDANDAYRVFGQKMAVDPNNPNVVYVGTPQNGMFVTTDGGVNWQQVSAVPASAQDGGGVYPGITGISFDPTSGVTGGRTNTIYASSYGHGVYESTDGGISWVALAGGPSGVELAAISTTGVYYAVGNNSVWQYADGVGTQFDRSIFQYPHTVSVDPFDAAHIIVAEAGGTLNQSLDGGATWSGQNWGTQLTAIDIPWLASSGLYMSIGNMLFDQLVPNRLWASAGVGVWNTTVPQNMAWDTPIVWNSQTIGIENLVANEIIVPPGGHPVFASWDRPFFYVADPDSYPSSYGVGNPNYFSMGWSIDYASTTPSFLVGINDWWGVEQSGYSSDGGQTWHMFPTMPSFAEATIGGTIAASTPTEIVWAPANRGAPEYTQDGGLTWHPVVLPGVTDWSDFHFAYYLNRQTVAADRVLPDTFYMYYVSGSDAVSNGVYRSSDGGATWTRIFEGQISDWSYYNARIEAVPGQAGHLFFTGGPQGSPDGLHPVGEGFYQSTDGGATWTAVPNVLEVLTFGFGAPAEIGDYPSIYIVGWVNGVYGIWQSNDDAQSWIMLGDYPEATLDNITTISGDPSIYGQVYVGFGGSGYAYLPATPPIDDQAPVVTALNHTLAHNENIAASSLFTVTDPDGDAIVTYALKDMSGGGYFVVNGIVQASNVEITLSAAQLAQTTYVAGSGSDQISIRASDGTLWSARQTATIDLANTLNRDPVALNDNASASTGIGGRASGNVRTNDSDPDGDSLAITPFSGAGAHGNLALSADGLFSYTVANLTGPTGSHLHDIFTYTLSDGYGGTNSANLDITLNRGPDVTSDIIRVKAGATTIGNVFGNDSDPDGDALAITAISGGIVGQSVIGAYGALLLNSDGSYSYLSNRTVPGALFSQDTFTFTESDGHGGSVESTLTFSIFANRQILPISTVPGALFSQDTFIFTESDGVDQLLPTDFLLV